MTDCPESHRGGQGDSSSVSERLIPLVVVVLTGLAMAPSLGNGFVNWDDQLNIIENPFYRGLGWTNLRWMFTTFLGGPYQPLSWMTLGLDYCLWGMNPLGYHLTSVVLHVATVLAFYVLSLRLIRHMGGPAGAGDGVFLRIAAALSALLFGIHPLRVESVAWVTERRDVVSGLFFVLTILAYLKAYDRPAGDPTRRRWYHLSIMSYAASLLGKGMGVTLPIILVVLDVYPLRRLGMAGEGWFGLSSRPVWREKLPYLVLAFLAGAAGIYGQIVTGAVASTELYGWDRRIGVTLYATAFYLYKTLFPAGLSPLYPMPQTMDLLTWPYLLAGGVLAGLTVAVVKSRHRYPGGLALWVGYLVMLAPVSGLTQMGPQIAADRYTYLSCLGWPLLAGVGLWRWSADRRVGLWATVCLSLPVLIFAGLTAFQTTVWRDSVSLWSHAGKLYPQSHIIQQNWGASLAAAGDQQGALKHYQEAGRLAPKSAEAENNIGMTLLTLGRPKDAEVHLRRSLELKPTHASAHYNLGNVMLRLGRWDEATACYRTALEHRSNLVNARLNLAMVLDRQGQVDEAERQWKTIIQQAPFLAMAYDTWATSLCRRGHYNEAVAVLKQGLASCGTDRSLALRQIWLYAAAPVESIRNGTEAIRMAEAMNLATGGRDAMVLDALAAACAEAGRKDDAVHHATRALQLATSEGKSLLAQQIQGRLEQYKAGRTIRSVQ